jgi:hypothetical protein
MRPNHAPEHLQLKSETAARIDCFMYGSDQVITMEFFDGDHSMAD